MNQATPDAAAQAEVIAFLSDPAAHAGAAPVLRIDTHASLLFLAGDHVYKLKREVVFSYLDYSTVERREQACRRELALNRRTAPDLYLEVRAIRRRLDGGLGFDGDGPCLDWVVVMRRFEQQDLFDRMAESGRLTQSLMRDLGDTIVAFHRSAEAAPGYGTLGGWTDLIEGNRRNLLAHPGLDADRVAQLTERTNAALERAADLLEQRRRAGKVRRCHGDLHLGNVCLFGGRVTLFDAIEFSDAIACIDLLYDFAFLAMDLHHRGRDALGSILFNRYLDLSDELDGLACLPLFMSIRAAIRAHVALAASQRQADANATDREQAAARSYLDRAARLLDPVSPRLIAVGGLSGSGKSTLAAGLAGRLPPPPGARIVRSDVLRKRLLGVAPETRLAKEAYSQAMSDRVYRTMAEQARSILAAGYSVILDATFMDPAERGRAQATARAANVPFTGLWLEAPPDLLHRRVAGRTGDASDADVAVLAAQLAVDLGPIDWQRIDAAGNDPLAASSAALAETGA